MQYAHEQGLVHRDIKPSNLLLAKSKPGPQGAGSACEIKILDLGLARLQHPAAGSKTSNLTLIASRSIMQGTPDYLAPEQAIDFHSADIRADIYSLGCTFYFLLAAQPPFGGGSLSQKLIRHHQAEAPPVERVRRGVPGGVSAIIRRMLEKKPGDRYQTPGEVAQALASFCNAGSTAIQSKVPSTLSLNVDFTPASGTVAIPGEQPRQSRLRSTFSFGFSCLKLACGTRRRLVASIVGVILLAIIGTLLFRPGGETGKTNEIQPPGEPAIRIVPEFSGNNQFVPLPDDIFRSSETVTLEAWFRTTASGGGGIVGYQHTSYPKEPGEYVPVLSVGTDGLLRGQFWNSGANPITSPAKVNDGNWHHVALVADGPAKMQTLYLDGNPLGTLPGEIKHLSMSYSQIGLTFGGWAMCKKPWHAFEGNIAEVRVWHVARSQSAIQQTKDKSLSGTEAGLVGYFPLNELMGDMALDRSPLGRSMQRGAGVPSQQPSRKLVPSFLH
jgi:hypothetical protein